MKVTCVKCQKPFRFKAGYRPRTVCDKCKRKRWNAYLIKHRKKLRKNPKEEHMKTLDTAGVSRMRLSDVAKHQKTSAVSVHQLERSALTKIRAHPDARRLFELWKEEGCPVPERPDPGAELLQWHLQLSDWWNFYDELRSRELFEEAAEMLAEIESFYDLTRSVLVAN